MTHLAIEQDRQLSKQFPEIDLILGGHEHENIHVERDPNRAPIYKADANARTAYIHDLTFNRKTKSLHIESRLQRVTDEIPMDRDVQKLVEEWKQQAFDAFRKMGFNPENPVAQVPDALDGTEASVRNHSTTLTDLIAKSMVQAYPKGDIAIYNSGMIRIDDIVPPGILTEYDVLRILPFGGTVVLVEMKGNLLQQVLEQGQKNRGKGGYLQTANVQKNKDKGVWLIKGEELDENKAYGVIINDFLLLGKEQGLEFLTAKHKDLKILADDKIDIRKTLIKQLQTEFGDSTIASALPQSNCPLPPSFDSEKLPSVKLSLRPSRAHLTTGEPWSITGLVVNQSTKPIYIVNRFTMLALPLEILGAEEAVNATIPASFPTTEKVHGRADYFYQVVAVFPQHSYPFIWDIDPLKPVRKTKHGQENPRDIISAELTEKSESPSDSIGKRGNFFEKLKFNLTSFLLFQPNDYKLTGTLHYWKENPKQYLDCTQSPISQADVTAAPSIVTTIPINVQTSTWVLLFGTLIGSVSAYVFLVVMGKRIFSRSGAVGAFMLGPMVVNQSTKPIYIVNRFTMLALPLEILGAEEAVNATIPASFPTTEKVHGRADYFYQVVAVFPQHSYPFIWDIDPLKPVRKTKHGQENPRDIISAELTEKSESPSDSIGKRGNFFEKLKFNLTSFLLFQPNDYKLTGTLHYWKENPKQYLDCTQSPISQADVTAAPSIVTTIPINVQTSTWVLLFGTLIGSVSAYVFLVVMGKRIFSRSGAVGAFMLGPMVALFLQRIGEATFFIAINVNDFWGAIVVGFIAQYAGLKTIDRFLGAKDENLSSKEVRQKTPGDVHETSKEEKKASGDEKKGEKSGKQN